MAISVRPISRGRWWCEARTPITDTDWGGSRPPTPLIPWRSMMAGKELPIAQWTAQLGSRGRRVWVFECRRLRERSRPLLRERARIETCAASSTPPKPAVARSCGSGRGLKHFVVADLAAQRLVARSCGSGRGLKHALEMRSHVGPPVARSCGSGRGLKPGVGLAHQQRGVVARSCGSGRGLKRSAAARPRS